MTKQMPIYRWLTLILIAGALLLVLGTATEVFAQAEVPADDAAVDAVAADSEAEAEADTSGTNWLAFLGRLHMVVLHLPIGLLLGAFILEVFGIFRRSKGYDIAAAWTLALGTLSAIVAVVFGLFLEEVQGGGSLTEQWHKWLGIAVAGLAIIAMIGKIIAVRKQWGEHESGGPGGMPLTLARLSLLGATILLPVVGHLGGNMVHGKQYLFEHSPVEVPAFVVHFPDKAPAAAATGGEGTPAAGSLEARWVSDIQPIFDAHCIKCHGDAKQNADLRLDSLELALLGSEEYGPVIVTGSAELSPLYQVITLPPESDRFMPPGKDHALSLENMRTIGTWLIDSANLGNEPTPGTPGTPGGGDAGEPEVAEPAFDSVAAVRLTELGGSYAIEAQGSDRIAISFANHKDPIPAEAFAAIEKLAEHVYRLDFTASGVTDEDLGRLPALPALDKLYLKDTAVTDAGLANLPEMFSIRYINLFGAAGVTDAGLANLEELFTLEEIFLSDTAVTIEGVNALREAMGDDVEVVYDDTVGLIETPVPDAGTAAQPEGPTVPVNTTCPVTGAAIDAAHTVTHDGKLVAFCCPNCLAKFNEDPTPFLANLP